MLTFYLDGHNLGTIGPCLSIRFFTNKWFDPAGYQRKAEQLLWWIRRLHSLIHPTIFGYQRKFVGWIKRSESTENCTFNQESVPLYVGSHPTQIHYSKFDVEGSMFIISVNLSQSIRRKNKVALGDGIPINCGINLTCFFPERTIWTIRTVFL